MGAAMNPGVYEVKMWNGRIGILQRDTRGSFEEYMEIEKKDLPPKFGGYLVEGEHISVEEITVMEAVDRPQMPRRMQLFLELEAERRKMYGAKSI